MAVASPVSRSLLYRLDAPEMNRKGCNSRSQKIWTRNEDRWMENEVTATGESGGNGMAPS